MKTISVSFLVVGMLLPTICVGQEQPAKSPLANEKGRRAAPKSPEQVWNLTDVDQDGFISNGEFSAMPRVQKLPEEKREMVFKRLDKDVDGKLSKEELSRYGKQHPGPPLQRLWELDSDKSGGVNFEEFTAGDLFKKLPPDKREQMFRSLDTDGDGLITPQDKPVPAAPRTFNHKLDLDGDGALSFEEFRKGANLKNLTEDQQEQRFEKIDRNGDLKISAEDFPPPPPDAAPAETN